MAKFVRYAFVLALAIVLSSCSAGSLTNDNSTLGGGKTMSAAGPLNSSQPGAVQPAAGSGRFIVVLKPAATSADAASLGASLSACPDQSYRTVFNGFAGVLTASEVARLKADPKVAYVEPDLPVQAFATPPPQVLPWGVDRIDAELNFGNGGAGVAVAVIDTGINLSHPDLAGAVVANYNVLRPGNPAEDDNGHGSHVAGIIGARNNTIGVVGVAPSCSLVAVKVLNRNGSGTVSGIDAGIDWVTAHASQYGIKVANMSLGGSGFSQSMHDAIGFATNAGVTFVVAAGNSHADAANYFPASFDNVICVSATDSGDKLAYFSNYGSTIELAAPGVNINSLYKNGGYATMSGTSMASPHVAGSAALYLHDHSGSGNRFAEVRDALKAAGYIPTGGWGSYDLDGITEPLVYAATL